MTSDREQDGFELPDAVVAELRSTPGATCGQRGSDHAYVGMQRSCTRTDPAGQVVTGRRSTVRLTATQTTIRATTMTAAITHFI